MLAPNVASFEGKAHTSDVGALAEVPCRGDGACVSLERLGPILPNGTVTGSVVLRGAYGPLAGRFSLTKHILFSHHLSHSWQAYH